MDLPLLKSIVTEMPDYTDSWMLGKLTGKSYSSKVLSSCKKMENIYLSPGVDQYFNPNVNCAVIVRDKPDEDLNSGFDIQRHEILCQVSFHDYNKIVPKSYGYINIDQVVQVQLVNTASLKQQQSYAASMYFNLVANDYVIVCDNHQYRGGKLLWLSIIRDASKYNAYVYVIDNGEFRMKDGKILILNGTDIDEDSIWSEYEEDQKKFTVLVLGKHKVVN